MNMRDLTLKIGDSSNMKSDSLTTALRLGQKDPAEQPAQEAQVAPGTLEIAVSRLVEVGILSPRQGFNIIFRQTQPEAFYGDMAAKAPRGVEPGDSCGQ